MTTVSVTNGLPFSILVFGKKPSSEDALTLTLIKGSANDAAGSDDEKTIKPTQSANVDIDNVSYLVAKSGLSGALIGEVATNSIANNKHTFDESSLAKPNAIGLFPEPDLSKGVVLPGDSERKVVGYGEWTYSATVKMLVIREQCWRRCSDSYVLAPKEKRTMGVATSTGIERSSSSEESLSKEFSAGASGGWGFFSASISASLSASSRYTQQVTISEQQSEFDTVELTNDTDKAQLFIRWRLADIILLVVPGGHIKYTLELSQAPFLIGGHYNYSPSIPR